MTFTGPAIDSDHFHTPVDGTMRVEIISTGGTFGMQLSARGFRPAPVAERIEELLRVAHLPGLAYSVTEIIPQIDSANACPEDWQQLVNVIDATYDNADGFVVIHGTDTMAYSASAVSYAVARRGKPIVFTGAQRPLSVPDSDGPANILGALKYLLTGFSRGVDLYFGGSTMPGNRAVKVSSTALAAFIAPHLPNVPFPSHTESTLQTLETFTGYANIEVPVIGFYPGMSAQSLAGMLGKDLPGAVLQCYGSGNAPSTPGLLNVIAEASERGQVIIAVSQCLEGRIALRAYEASTGLANAGVADGADMTTAAALTKLHYLFGCGLTPGQVRDLGTVNLAGELTASAQRQ